MDNEQKNNDFLEKESSTKKKQFRKSHADYLKDMYHFSEGHREWRTWTRQNKKGFFPIYSPDFINKAKTVSGNAIKLYVYLGAHIDNQAGYTLLSVDTMAKYFETSSRTVHNWLRELKENKLILRIQPAFKQPTQTYLLPYHDEFYESYYALKLKNLIKEYNNEEQDKNYPSDNIDEINELDKIMEEITRSMHNAEDDD